MKVNHAKVGADMKAKHAGKVVKPSGSDLPGTQSVRTHPNGQRSSNAMPNCVPSSTGDNSGY